MYTYKGNAVDYITNITTGGYSVSPTQDIDERYTGKTVNLNGKKVDSETVTYKKTATRATHRPIQITHSNSNITYRYDSDGNITLIMQGGMSLASYEYDTLGRLTRENNLPLGESYFYTYDNNGNILAKERCAFTSGVHMLGTGDVTSYNYDKDKLLSFGSEINVYDAMGNPTTYRGKPAVWTRGRKLISYNGNTFDYDAQGARIKKNDILYYYDSHERLLKQSNGLEFFYDTMGLVGVTYKGDSYVYRKDVQGNIIAILDSNGNVVVEYRYDAWGNHKVYNPDGTENADKNFIGNINPFRYRSYYFDTETGFYYLQTRYYDPEVGRFINMDSIEYADPETINGLNLFAYCLNNPVYYIDVSGNIPFANSITRIVQEKTIKGYYNKWWGRAYYSVSVTAQSAEPGFFYSYTGTNIHGVDTAGVGLNVWGWLGLELGVNYEGNLTAGFNITPWFHGGVELGTGGINISLGINIDDTSHDISFGIGAGLIAAVVGAVAVVGSAGQMLEPVRNLFNCLFNF